VRLATGGAFTLIDESYNANPLSMTAAFKSLGARPATGRRIAALTDMLELGDQRRNSMPGLPNRSKRRPSTWCSAPVR
jgi:UDP-N-acetylmuramoyl-tripeptide--D-alanyl-D-alanine ligase